MSFSWRGLAPLIASFLLASAPSTYAEGLQHRVPTDEVPETLFQVADSDLGLDGRSSVLDELDLGDRQLLEDFHPETDRWTDRNNRIRISFRGAFVAFSNELRIEHDGAYGFRINWEVPGFIGIRWDSNVVPFSRMRVRNGNNSDRTMAGITHFHTLALGVFNPELSVSGLAFWAGFGGSLWFYDYQEDNVFGTNDASYDDINLSGNIFIELDYEIADIVHISLEIRQHFVLAPQTDDGRFYQVNGGDVSLGDGRNDGQFDDMAGVTEIGINLSFLF